MVWWLRFDQTFLSANSSTFTICTVLLRVTLWICCSFRKLLQNVGKLHVPLGKIETWLNLVQVAQGTVKLLAEAVRCCPYNPHCSSQHNLTPSLVHIWNRISHSFSRCYFFGFELLTLLTQGCLGGRPWFRKVPWPWPLQTFVDPTSYVDMLILCWPVVLCHYYPLLPLYHAQKWPPLYRVLVCLQTLDTGNRTISESFMDMQLMSWSFEGRYEPFLEHLKLNLLFQYILRNIAHLYVHILYICTQRHWFQQRSSSFWSWQWEQ
jgi:hypothetical protein